MEYKSSLIQSGALLLLILAALFGHLLVDSSSKEKTLSRLNNQITDVFKSTLPNVKRIVEPAHQMRMAIEDLKKSAPSTVEKKKNVYSIDILNEISSRVPEDVDVLLSRLVIDEDNVLVSGDTPTFNTVDDLKSRLEDSPIFTKVTISSANMEKSGGRVRFKLKIQF
jgi:type II secretory pathway component PulL